jgi:hypothetical protein
MAVLNTRHVNPPVEFIHVSTLIAEQPRPLKETLDNQQNAETQRERYYATIHKVALQAGGDKIPGNSGLYTYVWSTMTYEQCGWRVHQARSVSSGVTACHK